MTQTNGNATAAWDPDDTVEPDGTLDQQLARFEQATGIPLQRLVRHGDEPDTARWSMTLTDGRTFVVGTTKALLSKPETMAVLAVRIGEIPAALMALKPVEYVAAIAAVIKAGTRVENSEGESFNDHVREWATAYMRQGSRDKDGAAANGRPYTDPDTEDAHISAQEFARWIKREYMEPVKVHEIQRALRDLGLERRTIHYRVKGAKPNSRSYYAGTLEAPHV